MLEVRGWPLMLAVALVAALLLLAHPAQGQRSRGGNRGRGAAAAGAVAAVGAASYASSSGSSSDISACGNKPPTVTNALVTCKSASCIAKCKPGVRFKPPYATLNTFIIVCRKGRYQPISPTYNEFPECDGPPDSGACSECACTLEGKDYEAGEKQLKKTGNAYEGCSCSNSKWECKPLKKGRATVWGDPHYITVDGRKFDFQGQCDYVLMKHDNFTIVGENVGCQGNAQGVKFMEHGRNLPTCMRSLTLNLPAMRLRLLQGKEVKVNGRTVSKFPYEDEGIKITMGSMFLVVELDNGLEIQWDGVTMGHFTVPEPLFDQISGLLGTYTGDAADDFTAPDGSLAANAEDFGNAWKADDSCKDAKKMISPCDRSAQGKQLAEEKCAVLKGPLFSACHSKVDTEAFYEACMFDVCHSQGGFESALCTVLGVYARECAAEGINIEWRQQVEECAVQCPPGQVFLPCGSACTRTCADITSKPQCEPSCTEGCGCPKGQVLDRNDKCVPENQCPCTHNGVDYDHGKQIVREVDDVNAEKCTCTSGKWVCKPQPPATCHGWGDPHYTSFDGRKFDHMGRAKYYLVKHKDFIIENQNAPWAGGTSIVGSLTIRIDGQAVHLLHGRQVKVNGRSVTLPYEGPGIKVVTVNSKTIHALLRNGVKVSWDGLYYVQVTVPGKFAGSVTGICGTFTGNTKTFLTSQGTTTTNIHTFCESWRTDDSGLPDVFRPPPCEKSAAIAQTAEQHCIKIKGSAFAKCLSEVDPEPFLEDCRVDVCVDTTKAVESSCNIFETYAAACTVKGINLDWRKTLTDCKLPCPAGQEYQTCGDSCSRSCRDIAANPSCKTECVDGCNCPKGQTLDDNNKCIPISQCKCVYQRMQYQEGQKITKEDETGSQRCTCKGAKWECSTQESATCVVWGDPHYTTFDGKKYDFMGQCSYYLLKLPKFSIEGENEVCSGGPTCTKKVFLRFRKFWGDLEVELSRDFEVKVDGKVIKNLPLEEDDFTIRMVSGNLLRVELKNGIQVDWNGKMRVAITVPGTYVDRTQGLCGTFNDDPADDFLTSEETVSGSAIEFGNSWKTEESCIPAEQPQDPCRTNPQKKATAQKLCNKLKEKVFAGCNKAVDVAEVLAACEFDVCASGPGQENSALCGAMQEYAQDCAAKGIVVDFKKQVAECVEQCPAGQEYQVCGDSCTRTCRDVAARATCKTRCAEGCNCPKGSTLDAAGKCVPFSKCPCVHEGKEYLEEQSVVQTDGKTKELCTCLDAEWKCKPQKSSRCTVAGDSHYTTFDGTKYTFEGNCGFYLFRTADTKVHIDTGPCKKGSTKICTLALLILVDKVTVSLTRNGEVRFNTMTVQELPYTQRGVTIHKPSSTFIAVQLPSGVEIWWDMSAIVYVDAPASLYDLTQGLCGNFNGDPKDDLTTSKGALVKTAAEFANSWKSKKGCTDGKTDEACAKNPRKLAEAQGLCKAFLADPFSECHGLVSVAPFKEACEFEACECESGGECTCPMYEVYAMECAAHGLDLVWRPRVQQCAMTCPAGQDYQVCGDSCARTCRDLQRGADTCQVKCAPGCTCPSGKILDEEGTCVELEDCPCLHAGKEFKHGSEMVKTVGNNKELCTCGEGQWRCEEQKGGRCVVVKNKFVTSFDGRKLSMDSRCQYTMLKTQGLSVQSGADCTTKKRSCIPSIAIDFGDSLIKLAAQEDALTFNGKKSTLPFEKNGIVIRKESSVFLVVKLPNGVDIKWDKASKAYIEVPAALYGKTQGVCGTFTNAAEDDLVSRDLEPANSVEDFLESWKSGDACSEGPEEPINTCGTNARLKAKAQAMCSILLERPFAACHEVEDVGPYHENCQWAVCGCEANQNCECDFISVYADECAAQGVPVEWRKRTPQCGMTCPAPQVYSSCGAACSLSCRALSEDTPCEGLCSEGCRCPAGQALDRHGACVKMSDCPCVYEGADYSPGKSIVRQNRDKVEQCTCGNGRWQCKPVVSGRCTNLGLPHYTTFDGTSFSFQANCRYHLVRTPHFGVEAELHACKPQQAGKFTQTAGTQPTCAKSVTVRVGRLELELGQEGEVTANGNTLDKLPKRFNGGVDVRRAAGNTVIVSLPKGGEVWWDGATTVRIDVSPSYFGKTQGLCGTFNGDKTDDMQDVDGEMMDSATTFANAWSASEACEDNPTVVDVTNTCNAQKKRAADQKCAVLLGPLFKPCHDHVSVDAYHRACILDSCACTQGACECDAIITYAEDCADAGVKIAWMKEVSLCGAAMHQCSPGQDYQECGDSCGQTCRDQGAAPVCKSKCVAGCGCPHGQAIDPAGKCVPLSKCNCMHNEHEFPNGKQILRQTTVPAREREECDLGLEFCVCDGGHWDCIPADVDAVVSTCAEAN